MSYQVLARKWRPATFHEMQGQEHVLQALVNSLDTGRLHHAYLFTGTRGVGKTSVARILAKCLNCEKGVSSRPCGECGACLEIADNRFVDLIEVDAASRTKVEDTRDLLENVQYAPSKGRFKIYLIDEVHMLSTHSFNALLKTLEEPPPHVKFLLATTDPQRLPATILSRCLQFSLKNMSAELIVKHLATVLAAEKVQIERPALQCLARAAGGSMRDALSLTDQAIAFSGGGVGRVIAEQDVRDMLGSVDRDTVCELLDALVSRDTEKVLTIAENVVVAGIEVDGFLAELLSSLHALAVFQAVPNADVESVEHGTRLKSIAATMPAEDVQLNYQIAIQAQRDLPFAPDTRTGLEMALLRMLSFLPATLAEPSVNDEPSVVREAASSPAAAPAPPAAAPPPQEHASVSSAPEAVASAAPATQVQKKKSDVVPTELTADNWLEVFDSLPLAGMARHVAANCELLQLGDRELIFRLDDDNCKLLQATHVAQLEEALQTRLGKKMKAKLERGKVNSETPFLYAQRCQRERQEAAVESIMSDPNVTSLLQTFGGRIEQSSIAPVQSSTSDDAKAAAE